MFYLGFTGAERKKTPGTTEVCRRTSEDVRQNGWKGMAVLGVSKVFVFIGLILVDLAHIARGQNEILARRYEILGDAAGNESGDRLLERLYLNGEDKEANAIMRALERQDPDVMTWLAENAARAAPSPDIRDVYDIMRRRPQYIGKRDLRRVVSPPATGTDVAARRRKRSERRSATDLGKPREKRAQRIFIGKKEQGNPEDSDVGFTESQSSLLRRFARMLGEGSEYKRLGNKAVRQLYNYYSEDNDKRSLKFIGRRGEDNEKRSRQFIGKRDPPYVGMPSEDAEKRSLKFIGKRDPPYVDMPREDAEKRSLKFIGKRDPPYVDMPREDAEKRSLKFIGKRDPPYVDMPREDAEKRSLKFIGKRIGFLAGRANEDTEKRSRQFIGRRDDDTEKRSRQFIGRRDDDNEKRSRQFIGKRADFAAGGSDMENAKRSLRFIGKRGNKLIEGNDGARETSSLWNDFDHAEKRSRQFIGKRYQLPSAADFRNRRRSQLFIGKRAAATRSSKRQPESDGGAAQRQKRASDVDGTGAGAAGKLNAQGRGA